MSSSNLLARLRAAWRGASAPALARRLAHFWIVWSLLLLVHEGGHAVSAWRQGLTVHRVTVGLGPVVWRGEHEGTQAVLRLVPLAGITRVGTPTPTPPAAAPAGGPRDAGVRDAGVRDAGVWSALGRQAITLAGGVLATLALAVGVAGLVAVWERTRGTRWVWGRIVVADAVVLTVFNFLPVPPLDGGRAVLGVLAAWRGAPLQGDALFWVHVGGLALAVVPMALWTRWTARIDAVAMRWGAPLPPAP